MRIMNWRRLPDRKGRRISGSCRKKTTQGYSKDLWRTSWRQQDIKKHDKYGMGEVEPMEQDKKSRCEQCEYYVKVSDAPETVEADCTWQPCENDGYTLPCERGED